MDTAKPLKPSRKADPADDLIEELARVMADNAQSSTQGQSATHGQTTPQRQPAAQGRSAAGATPQPPAGGTAPHENTPSGRLNLRSLDLGAPKAPATPVRAPSAPPSPPQPSAPSPRPAATGAGAGQSAAPQGAKPLDFDFGFGSGTRGDSASQAPASQTSASQGTGAGTPDPRANPGGQEQPAPSPPATPPANDPIADLINATVTRQVPANDVETPAPGAMPASEKPAQADSFAAPPVFGLAGKPSGSSPASPSSPAAGTPEPAAPRNTDMASQGRGASDNLALDEIESLIGESVKVGDSSPTPSPSAPSPSVQPLGDASAQMAVEGPAATPSAGPATNDVRDTARAPSEAPSRAPENNAPDSAEAAILQAMEAAGTATAQAGLTARQGEGTAGIFPPAASPVNAEDEADAPLLAEGRVDRAAMSGGSRSRIFVPLFGLVLVAAIGIGTYMFLNPGGDSAEAPVLTADSSPVRETPPQQQNSDEPRSVVLNDLGVASAEQPPQDEQLVSRDETQGATGNLIRQVITQDASENGLANRRVRTVTVRPDGTIITGEDSVAGGQELPVDQPNLPELPANAINTELSNTTVAALPNDALALATNAAPRNLVTVDGNAVPFPQPRLANRSERAAAARSAALRLPPSGGITPNTSTTPVPPANIGQPATPAPVTSSQPVTNPQAFVQLASQRSEDVARQTAASLQRRYASALNGGSLIVRRVDLGTRGVYFRVQLPTASLSSANAICDAIKNAGGDCFTRTN